MVNSIQKTYDDIAKHAFQNYTIFRENDYGIMEEFRLLEIEIYMINKKNNIDDIFIHKHEMQKEFQKEYVHYSGFDICLGNNQDIYCGILVRGLMNNEKVIYGPGRVKYNRKNKQKRKRKIEIQFNKPYEEELYFSDHVNNSIDINNIIFKLPRVNLSSQTINKYLWTKDNLNVLDIYLNLNARYIRLQDDQFYKQTQKPEELREIFNAIIQYNKKTLK
jgi:hypothetical protein